MGAESQGTIPAAGGPDGVILATFEKEAKAGSKVLGGLTNFKNSSNLNAWFKSEFFAAKRRKGA